MHKGTTSCIQNSERGIITKGKNVLLFSEMILPAILLCLAAVLCPSAGEVGAALCIEEIGMGPEGVLVGLNMCFLLYTMILFRKKIC